MIIIINSNGAVASIQDEDLFQGSTSFNYIDLLAPFADSVTFKAMFEMPDGSYKPDDLDGYIFQPSLKITDNLNTWRLPITFPITQDYGVVNMQIRGTIGDTVVCTTSVKLSIQKGVPYASNFEELSDKDQLLQMIADLRALLSTKVDKVDYNYVVAEDVTSSTVGTYYVVENELFVPKILPNDYDSTATYYSLQSTTRVTNNGTNLYLQYINNITNNEVKLEILEDKVLINNKQVVVFDDLVADNIDYDDTNTNLSAQNVQEALEKLKLNLDNAASVIDVGDITLYSANWQQVGSIYTYTLFHAKLTDSLKQSVIITPNDTSINLLNTNDVLLYPTVEISNYGPLSTNNVHATIKADTRPSFDIIANLKIVNNKIDGDFTSLSAGQISYSNTIAGEQVSSVGDALTKLNTNLSFTYVVDSNTKLKNWADNLNNTNATKYVSVLIKSGTYTINRGIDLSVSNTRFVYAEPNAYIRFTSSSGFTDQLSRNTMMFNVNASLVNLTTTNNFVFNGIGNLYHCYANIGSSTAVNPSLYGFVSCNNLIACRAESNGGQIKVVGFSGCSNLNSCTAILYGNSIDYGFELCNNLTDCIGIAWDSRSDARGFNECKILRGCQGRGRLISGATGMGYGFTNCKGVSYCKRDNDVYTSTTATFDYCYADISTTEDNPDYLVANTPAGGFNDVT